MQVYWTLVRRELGAHFFSWTGYVVIAAVTFLLGLSLWSTLEALNSEPTDRPVTELFFASYYFWIILILSPSVITMRSFALEKYSGTFETLMTTPVSDLQVVLAKFSGALLFYVIMWLPLLACLAVVRHYSNEPALFDTGVVISTFLGIILLGGMYLSLGCFASAITRSQIIAVMVGAAGGVAIMILSFVSLSLSSQTGWKAQVFRYVGLFEQMQDFARGVVDTRPVMLYVSSTIFFLFLTLKVVESRRWK